MLEGRRPETNSSQDGWRPSGAEVGDSNTVTAPVHSIISVIMDMGGSHTIRRWPCEWEKRSHLCNRKHKNLAGVKGDDRVRIGGERKDQKEVEGDDSDVVAGHQRPATESTAFGYIDRSHIDKNYVNKG